MLSKVNEIICNYSNVLVYNVLKYKMNNTIEGNKNG
ncbi:MAG: Unknown protein [uncultured Thiotrichaceae bacterium]|uniref:Uncharacterized protein n=1 Tax=uncultured Thiotrichaceae bacterium TaxID=298394 RepID=A0A6S6UGM7_9GAMM|nr:MAG: Unknown protein [uncultured Thiotrichaceae bacterium]